MDYCQFLVITLSVIIILIKDVELFSITVNSAEEKAVYGQPFTLACSYSFAPEDGNLFFVELFRKRDTENESRIIFFALDRNATYNDSSLQNRVTSSWPSSSSQNRINVVFSSIECSDKALYRWKATYLGPTAQESKEATINVSVRVDTTFNTDSNLSFSPASNIEEGDEVTFSCTGDAGNEPVGHLKWFYYLNNDTSMPVDVSVNATTFLPVCSCSCRRTSTLRLMMKPEFNNILVRCTIQQDTFNQFGDGYRQTSNIKVYYSPKVATVDSTPGGSVYQEGDGVVFTCRAVSYPESKFYWVLPDGNETVGARLELANLTVEDSGNYVCVAYSEFKGSNHTVNTTKTLTVQERTTTTTTTTTTTPTPGATDKEVSTQASTNPTDDSNTTTIVIAVVVPLVVIIIIAVVILCYCKSRNKQKEIEEPPEKPRNNQDLSFYGHRPDLVSADHGMKNNMGHNLNSSFNNSFDSSSDIKPRNDDGLMYIDLQFDDKPRSRRPVQLVDNPNASGASTPYADIVNPRV